MISASGHKTYSAAELLKRHGIDYVETKKRNFTTTCQHCGGGYLHVKTFPDRVAWYCHGCGESGAEKYEQRERGGGLGPIKAIYDYRDEEGNRLFQVLRFEPLNAPKVFRQRTGPDQDKWSIKGVRIVPFRLPELIEGLTAEHVIFVVEGEKDVNTLRGHNVPATCNPMGAGKWWPEFNDILRGADVVICGDNDEPGRNHVKLVAKNLYGVARRVRVLDLAEFWPGIEASDDISDWFGRGGGTPELLWEMVDRLFDWTPIPTGNGQDDGPPWEPDQQQYDRGPEPEPEQPKRLIQTSAQFVKDFVPPDYLIDGLLQCRYSYSFTGKTGSGKTAVVLLWAASVATGRKIGNLEVAKGRVLYFAGENPDDVRMRWIAMAQNFDFDIDTVDVRFIPGQFKDLGNAPAHSQGSAKRAAKLRW